MGVKNGGCPLQRLLFADDFALLDSIQNSLRKALIRYSGAYSVAGIKNQYRYYKTRNYVPVQATKAVFSPSWWSTIKTVGKIQVYLDISFSSDGRQNSELSMSKCSNVPVPLICGTGTWLCTKAKLSIFRSVYVPILTYYGHECRIMNEKVRSRVQAAEMRFLRRISDLTQGCELDRFLTEFKFEVKRYLQVRVQARVLRILLFEFEIGKNDRVRRVQILIKVRVLSPELCRSQWHEQINDMQLFFW